MMLLSVAEADRDHSVAEAKRLLIDGDYDAALDVWHGVL